MIIWLSSIITLWIQVASQEVGLGYDLGADVYFLRQCLDPKGDGINIMIHHGDFDDHKWYII